MSLQQKLEALKQGFQASAPREVLEVMARAQKELQGLRHPGPRGRGGRPGARLQLPNARGKDLDLKECLKRGPVVLGFYRGRW